MGQPAAKQGDQITGLCQHDVIMPNGSTANAVPHSFAGILDALLSPNVNIMSMPAATIGSQATNTPVHIPNGASFVNPPTNLAQVTTGSPTVNINGKPAARTTDTALICSDPAPLPNGSVVAVGTVLIG